MPLRFSWFAALSLTIFGCSGSGQGETPAARGSGGSAGAGSGGRDVGSSGNAGVGTSSAGGDTATAGGVAAGGISATGGASGSSATTGGVASGGALPNGGASGGGGNPANPGNYPDPPRAIKVTRTDKISIGFAPSAADAGASGSQHYGEFDPTKPLQKKLVVPMGGVNSDPWKLGWAVDRGYHVLTVDLWNDYPKDPGYPEYLESWSGDDLSTTVNQPKNNSVMARVKAGLAYLQTQDPSSDWGYYLDAAGEVRWNDVIVFGYSFGGQMGVAASKYVAADRIIITSAPNVPIDSAWLKQPSKTPVERCFFLGGNKDGEHPTHKAETLLLGWPGDVLNVTHVAPPYATNRLEVDDGHSSFCGRPFADGMVDWDSICEFMFHTQKK